LPKGYKKLTDARKSLGEGDAKAAQNKSPEAGA